MEYFDERMAIDVIEDALTDIDTPHGRGVATGLGSTFHMCGLINEEQWETFLNRIPEGSIGSIAGGITHWRPH